MAERRPRPERRREGIKSDRLAVVLPLLGPRAATPGVAANSGPSIDVSSTAHCAASTGRVPGLGGVSSSPVHRAFVLVLGTNIAVLLDCSKSSRQCSLPYLLTTEADMLAVERMRRPAAALGPNWLALMTGRAQEDGVAGW